MPAGKRNLGASMNDDIFLTNSFRIVKRPIVMIAQHCKRKQMHELSDDGRAYVLSLGERKQVRAVVKTNFTFEPYL
jgi:hypothetical protein